MRYFGSDRRYLKGATKELNGVYLFQKASLTSIQPDLPTMKCFHGEREYLRELQTEEARMHKAAGINGRALDGRRNREGVSIHDLPKAAET